MTCPFATGTRSGSTHVTLGEDDHRPSISVHVQLAAFSGNGSSVFRAALAVRSTYAIEAFQQMNEPALRRRHQHDHAAALFGRNLRSSR